jgi:hypothetical protein
MDLVDGGGDSFWYVQLFDSSAEPTHLFLDTNVVSHAESILNSAFDPSKVSHRRILNLATRLQSEPALILDTDAALLEGSSFSATTGLNPLSLVRRSMAVNALHRRDVSVLFGEKGTIVGEFPQNLDNEVERNLSLLHDELLIWFVPGYLAALEIERLIGRNGAVQRIPEDTAEAVLLMLHERLDYVPRFAWHVVLSATVGTLEVCRDAMGVLKTGRLSELHEITKNAFSAAWDIALLERISLHLGLGHHPVLVTDDRRFGSLARTMESITEQGRLPREVVGDSYVQSAERLYNRYRELRGSILLSHPMSTPSALEESDLVTELEAQVGVQSGLSEILKSGFKIRYPDLVIDAEVLREIARLVALMDDGKGDDEFDSWLHSGAPSVVWLNCALLIGGVLLDSHPSAQEVSSDNILAAIAPEDIDILRFARHAGLVSKFAADRESLLLTSAQYEMAIRPSDLIVSVIGCLGVIRLLARSSANVSDATVTSVLQCAVKTIFARISEVATSDWGID